MKIGIDIDGVLTDEHTYVLDNGTKYFSENNISYIVNRSVYDSEGIFGVSEDEYNANDTVELLDMIVIDCDDDTYWILNNGYGFLSKDDTKFYIKYDDQVYDTLNDIVEGQSISE